MTGNKWTGAAGRARQAIESWNSARLARRHAKRYWEVAWLEAEVMLREAASEMNRVVRELRELDQHLNARGED
jgi:hypothetical protein